MQLLDIYNHKQVADSCHKVLILHFHEDSINSFLADKLCKQFGPRSELTEGLSWSGSKPFWH